MTEPKEDDKNMQEFLDSLLDDAFKDSPTFAAGRFAWKPFDGPGGCGFIKKISGGKIKGDVVKQKLGTGHQQRKHLSTITHEPISIEISMGMGREMWDWVKTNGGLLPD